jgi:hypothetical protein
LPQGASLTAPGLTVDSPVHAESLLFIEGHWAGSTDFDGQQPDFAGLQSLTAPGLALSSSCFALAADGQVVDEHEPEAEQDDFDPSTTPGLTSAVSWVVEQPISRAVARDATPRTFTIVFFMDTVPLRMR